MDKVLIIDDEPKLRQLLSRIIGLEGYEVFQAQDCASGLKMLEKTGPDVVLCDVKLPDGNGVEMTARIKAAAPETEVILMTAYGNIPDGVQAMKNGAFDYITKGNDNNKILPLLARASEKARLQKKVGRLESQMETMQSFENIIGSSPLLQETIRQARKVAVTDAAVLLTGPTGTGKEVFARAIHQASGRSKGSFVAVNCSAFSKDLLESELFGHTAGAFTGAAKEKKGLMEEADGGTLFLDEIGEMPVELQAKLLRALESGEFLKVGETRPRRSDMRIIAATNRDLEEEIGKGAFREDLFYRLSVFTLRLPPLDRRPSDIEEYVPFFVKKFAGKMGLRIEGIEPEYTDLLKRHRWKGNVRELRNVIERSLIMAEGNILRVSDLPPEFRGVHAGGTFSVGNGPDSSGLQPEGESFRLSDIENRHILRILDYTGGNKAEAARLLGISTATLYRKLEELSHRDS